LTRESNKYGPKEYIGNKSNNKIILNIKNLSLSHSHIKFKGNGDKIEKNGI